MPLECPRRKRLFSVFVSAAPSFRKKKGDAPVGFLPECTARCRCMQVDEREIDADNKTAKWIHDFFVWELPFCLIFAESIDEDTRRRAIGKCTSFLANCMPCAFGAELKKRRGYPSFSAPPFRTKTMAFSPSLARPRVQCFPIFAFTSSPGGCKCLFPNMVRVKAQVQIAFTHGKVLFNDPKMAEFIGEQSGVL